MNKSIFLFLGVVLFIGINETKAQTQQKAFNDASVTIIALSEIAQVSFVNSAIQIIPTDNVISGTSIVVHTDKGKQVSSAIQNLASFSVNPENNNSFSISLPTDSIILKNSKSKNTIQVSGWQSSTQPGKDKSQKDIWVLNMGASLKVLSAGDKQEGFYAGTFPVSFDYN